MAKIKDAAAVLLCGGKSRRMGFDKVYIEYRQSPLLLRNATCLQKLFEQVVLVGDTREKLEGIPGLEGFPILTDQLPERGPLGGISTALSELDTKYIFVAACDMPNISTLLIKRMYIHIDNNQAVVCVNEGKMETLFAFYHQSCLPVFQKQLSEGNLQIRHSFGELTVKTIPLTSQQAGNSFANLNTPQDLAKWDAKQLDESV